MDQDCKGRARCAGVECTVKPFRMAVLLLSVRPLLDQALLQSYDSPIILIIGVNQELSVCLPPTPAGGFPGN